MTHRRSTAARAGPVEPVSRGDGSVPAPRARAPRSRLPRRARRDRRPAARRVPTANALTLPISGTGSAGMEACFVNLLEPGDTAIVGVNGVFGERMCEVARRCGAEVVRVDEPWGRAIDPQRLLDAHARHPRRAAARGRARGDVDRRRERVAPLAALQRDRHAAARRHRHVARRHPGRGRRVGHRRGVLRHAEVPRRAARPRRRSASPTRAVERVRGRSSPPQSWYLDLGLIADYVGSARRYHHTAPISMLYALHAGPRRRCSTKASKRRGRGTAQVGALLQDALPELGFRLFAEERRLPQLTSVWLPDGVDDAKVRGELLRPLRHRGRRRARRRSRARAGASA